jgi:hypothetical protein
VIVAQQVYSCHAEYLRDADMVNCFEFYAFLGVQ